ncbi:MAG: amidohydrolase [Chloroflexi bacterium]|nr:amidohydrolase [Chloroflexota bacterium]
MKYSVISSDSHVCEPGDVWTKRIDKKYRDRAPHLIHEGGFDKLVFDGLPASNAGMMGPAGRTPEQMKDVKLFEHNRKGGYDPDARLKDMAMDGVDAEVLYPTAGLRMWRLPDRDYATACIRAYNDWMAEFCATHPKQLKGLGLVPMHDIEQAVLEAKRIKQIGLAGVMITISPEEQRSYNDPMYEPLWATAADIGMPISMHILTAVGRDPFQQFAVDYASMSNWMIRSLTAIIFSGVFQRHPKLKMISVEADIGWVANFIHRMDHTMWKHGPRLGLKLEKKPSEYFRSNVLATFMSDEAGMRTWDIIGEDNIMWSNDYPHADSIWPNSQAIIKREFTGVPERAKKKILAENCAKLYGFA